MYRVKPGTAWRQRQVSQKRIWLAKLLCLGAGVSVSVSGALIYADVPTQRTEQNSGVRTNPYVAQTSTAGIAAVNGQPTAGKISQTSDVQASALRLRTIGTAVGLVPIGKPRPAQTILEVKTPSASQIRVNPLANQSPTAFESPVIETTGRGSGSQSTQLQNPQIARPRVHSQARIISVRNANSLISSPGQVATAGRPEQSADGSTKRTLPAAARPSTTTPIVVERTPIHQAGAVLEKNTQSVAKVSALNVPDFDDACVTFSMTDLGDEVVGETPVAKTEAGEVAEGLDPIMSKAVPATPEIPSSSPIPSKSKIVAHVPRFVVPAPVVDLNAPSVNVDLTTEMSETAEVVQAEPQWEVETPELVLGANSLPPLATPAESWVAKKKTESGPSNEGIVKGPSINQYAVKRYPDRRRAHVEVAAPPMVSYQVKRDLNERSSNAVSSTPIVPAELATFRRSNESGQSTESEGPRRSEAPVDSEAPVNTAGSGASNITAQAKPTQVKPTRKFDSLLQEIQKTYPSSRITMSEAKGKLVVLGMCADREEATEIIRLIRSKHLVPVDDRIQLY